MNSPQRSGVTWQAGTAATPLMAWRTAQLSSVAGGMASALAAWAADWGLPAWWHGSVDCVPAPASAPRAAAGTWTVLGRSGAGHAWFSPSAREPEQMSQALFAGASPLTELLLDIGEACRRDVLARLVSALLLEDAADDPEAVASSAFAPWRGSVLASLPWGACVLMEAAVVARLLRAGAQAPAPAAGRAASPLVPLTQAIASMTIPVQVHLTGCDLAIGSLRDLQPGDVLRLRHRLGAPAAVAAGEGRALFGGFLARSRGRKAIELAPAGAH